MHFKVKLFVGICLFLHVRHIQCEADISIEEISNEDFNIAEDMDCVFFDFDFKSSLNCSFRQPFDDSDTSYHLRLGTVETTCVQPEPDLNPRLLLCSFGFGDFDKFSNLYTFLLRSENRDENRTQYISINRAKCMMLEQPGVEVTLINKTAHSICLQWSNVRRDNHDYDIFWDLQLQPNASIIWQPPHYAKLKETLCLRGLPYADQEYNLTLRRRINVDRAHWSDYFNYTYRTEIDLNLASTSVKLTHSSYIFMLTIVYILNAVL